MDVYPKKNLLYSFELNQVLMEGAEVPKDQQNTEFPKDSEGRVYHITAKKGEVANRILLVGDPHRASIIKDLFTGPVFKRASTRGFLWYTGLFNGTPITVMAIGMGFPMMDFAIRELRAVVDGPMIVTRFGSSGSPHNECPVGTIVVGDSFVKAEQNVNAFIDESDSNDVGHYYNISNSVKPDDKLTNIIIQKLREKFPEEKQVQTGLTLSCDSYYSSQGRVDPEFNDRNENLMDYFVKQLPNLKAIEMESFHLVYLSKLAKSEIITASVVFILAQRFSNKFLGNKEKESIEKIVGEAIFSALASYEIDESKLMKGNCVWEQ